MNVRLEFWKNSTGWPRDNSSYVFLARAVHAIGKSMFRSEWTGDEPYLDLMQSLPALPLTSGSRAYFAHNLLLKHHPEFGRQPLKWSRGPFSSMPTSVKFSRLEWEAARAIVTKHNERKMPGVRRFFEARDRIIQLAEAGLLITAIRERAGGDPTPVPCAWWNSERIRNRFDCCQLNPSDPYGLGSSGDRYQWIFVTRESLMSCAGSMSSYDEQHPKSMATTPASEPSPSEDQGKPQRRLTAAKIGPEFQRWREQQPEGYIPTEAEDIAHMKRLGVGRDAVRQLRKKFPTRERGQKKSG
jgi:hypothetical protein